MAMLKNYLLTAFRTLRRQKGYAFLNVAGLAVGLACCAFIGLYVREELAYDDWHTDADRVYRITSDWGDFSLPSTNWPLIQAFQEDFPQVDLTYLVQFGGTVRRDDRHFSEDHLLFAPPSFFDVLSFRLERGDEATALARPYQIVLSRDAARKYFGEEDPMGQTVQIYGEWDVTVAGILAAPPGPSHIQPDFIGSWSTLDAAFNYTEEQSWSGNNQYTYLKLPEGMDASALVAAFPALIERHAGDDWNGAELGLQRLTDVHLTSHHNMELQPNGRTAYVWLFGAVAGFILLLACVNFMNLATARSLERAREVSVRKSVGAQRGQLAWQFLSEATLLALVGLVLAAGLVALALPAFRTLADRPLALDAGIVGPALLGAVLLTVGVGLLSGSYPALVLSGFRPAEVLRGRFSTSARGARLRQGLVVFQFAIAVILIVGTLGVHAQLQYLREADLHFDAPQIVSVAMPDDDLALRDAFLDGLRQRPEVLSVALSSEEFPSELLNGDGITLAGMGDPDELEQQQLFVPTRMVAVGAGFFETLGVEMAHGREFSEAFASDSAAVILNETAARMLQERFPEHLPSLEAMVGREIARSDGPEPLVGIARDFNMSSLHEVIEPVVFFVEPGYYNTFLVRVAPGSAPAEIDANVSPVSAHPAVRDALLDVQRRIARQGRVVMVGRDIGTVVVPDASVKIFLDASPEERAQRRCQELIDRGLTVTYDDVLADIRDRDRIDSERDVAPLVHATDALLKLKRRRELLARQHLYFQPASFQAFLAD